MLLAGIKAPLFAQTVAEQKFNVTEDDFDRRYTIDMGRGNRLQIELKSIDDLAKLENIDSLFKAMLNDLEPLRDSLKEQRSVKRIDYVVDSSGHREIRFRQWVPVASTYVKMPSGEFAALKTEQDTITYTQTIPFTAKYGFRPGFRTQRLLRLSLFINDATTAGALISAAGLNHEILSLKNNQRHGWTNDPKGGMQLKKDARIKARQANGYFNKSGDMLTLGNAMAGIANYKSYFVPSLSFGAKISFNTANTKREITFNWEPQFFFRTTQGKMNTYRNDFLTLTFGQGPIKDHDPGKNNPFLFNFSFAYQVRNKGDFYDKHTMRLGISSITVFEGKTTIEPVIYFHDLFKNVTPGIRLTQHF